MLRKLVQAILFCMVLSSCGLGQDPFRNESDSIKNGIPPITKPDTKPITADSVIFDVPNYMTFTEGKESTYSFDLRVLVPYKKAQIGIVNGPQGLEVDNVNKLIKWNPEVGIVEGTNQYMGEVTFSISVEAKDVLYMEKKVLLYVDKTTLQTQVSSLQDVPSEMLEGDESRFTVVVTEPGASEKRIPFLFLNNESQSWDCTKYIRLYDKKFENGDWKFTYEISLNSSNNKPAEITNSSRYCDVKAVAYSSSMVPGTSKSLSIHVKNLLKDLQWTWDSDLNLNCNQTNTYAFLIFDMDYSADINLSLPDLTGLPGSPTVACTKLKRGIQSCQLNWTCPAGTVGTYEVKISADSSDNYTNKNTTFTGVVNIN